MNGSLHIASSVVINDGCPIEYEVGGSGLAWVMCGDRSSETFEFQIDSEALRELVRRGEEALREMDARYAQEEADGRS